MKKIEVTLSAFLEIPDDWEVVEHPDGSRVLKNGDTFIDLDFMCLTTTSNEEGSTWMEDDDAEEEFLEYVKESYLEIKEQ